MKMKRKEKEEDDGGRGINYNHWAIWGKKSKWGGGVGGKEEDEEEWRKRKMGKSSSYKRGRIFWKLQEAMAEEYEEKSEKDFFSGKTHHFFPGTFCAIFGVSNSGMYLIWKKKLKA